MSHISTELSADWLNFARASLATRIKDTGQATTKVLNAVQAIATQLDTKQELTVLLTLKTDRAIPSEVIPLLQDILRHLDSQDELSQLIAPLYMALQFEDRTRQKLESLLEVMAVWAEVRNDDAANDEALAARLMPHVVSMEQQAILAKYFPDYIQVEEVNDEMEFF
jgi:arginine/lysine/ornithine decarboxylase